MFFSFVSHVTFTLYTLHLNMYRSTYKMMKDSTKESEPVSKGGRSGKKWTKEEDDELTEQLKHKMSYEDISIEHGRTETAVKMRAINNAVYAHGDENVEKIAEAVNLPIEIIQEFFKNKQDWKDKKDSERQEKKSRKEESSGSDNVQKANSESNLVDNTRILIKFKMFLKRRGQFTDQLDELFDEFMIDINQ